METINLEEAIASSRHLMGYDYSLIFRKYSMSYFTTTEFISDYLGNERFNTGSALTILASGDHVFSLALSGLQKINAFDINRLAYYVYYLKLAMLKKLPYDAFLKICYYFTYYSYKDEVKEMIDSLKNEMPEDVYEYFRRILEIDEKETGSIYNLFYEAVFDMLEVANPYLHSEDDYLMCRKRISDTEVNLYFGDARDIPDMVGGLYDIILLSNVADYLSRGIPLRLDEFRNYIKRYYDLLNRDGLLINYLYGLKDKRVISDSLITKEDLGKDNIVSCPSDILNNQGYYRVRK